MDQAWTYRRGSWSMNASPVAFNDDSGEQLPELEGFSPDTLWLGLEGGFQAEVYTRLKDNRTVSMPYLVVMYIGGDNREYIFVEDLPSLLQLLNSVAPIIQCSTEDLEAERDEEDELGAPGAEEDEFR